MKTRTILILVGVGLIILYFANKINTAKQLRYSLGLPQQIRVRGGAVLFELPVRVQNITATAINVKGVNFDVLSAGQIIGQAIINQAVRIEPNGFTTLPVQVSVSLLMLATAAGSIVNYFKAGFVGLTLDGSVYAEGFQVPVKTTFEFPYKSAVQNLL